MTWHAMHAGRIRAKPIRSFCSPFAMDSAMVIPLSVPNLPPIIEGGHADRRFATRSTPRGKATLTSIQTRAVALIDLHQCDLRIDGLL